MGSTSDGTVRSAPSTHVPSTREHLPSRTRCCIVACGATQAHIARATEGSSSCKNWIVKSCTGVRRKALVLAGPEDIARGLYGNAKPDLDSSPPGLLYQCLAHDALWRLHSRAGDKIPETWDERERCHDFRKAALNNSDDGPRRRTQLTRAQQGGLAPGPVPPDRNAWHEALIFIQRRAHTIHEMRAARLLLPYKPASTGSRWLTTSSTSQSWDT